MRAPDYDQGCEVRRVRSNGEIKWKGRTVFVTSALKGERVGLTRIGERSWLVKYGSIVLGTIIGESKMYRISPGRRRKHKKIGKQNRKTVTYVMTKNCYPCRVAVTRINLEMR